MREDEGEKRRGRRIWRVLWGVLVTLLLLAAAALALLPAVLPHLEFEERTFDLSGCLSEDQLKLARHRTATVHWRFLRSETRDLALRAKGRLLDWPYSLRADFNYGLFGPRADGVVSLYFDGTPWRIDGRFDATRAGWTFDAAMDPTAFDEKDPLLGALLPMLAAPAVTNLAFAGRLALEVHAADTNGTGLATWSVQTRLEGLDADMVAAEKPLSIAGLRLRAGVKGLGAHAEVQPMFPRADALDFAGLAMTNVFASIRATEKSFLVTEAGAGLCGGEARLYALFLDPERLSAGFTLFLDDIDAGLVLNRLAGFRGAATGRLHGKLPLRIRDGERISVGDAYLYSVPGEEGTVRLEDPTPILDHLALGGVSQEARANLAKALRDLTYTALNIQLRREETGTTHALSFKLQGSATSGRTTVPVSFAVTLRGDLEQLINTGIILPKQRRLP